MTGAGGPRAPGDLEATRRAQHEASTPTVSAWVSANAGAGKTHVLKMRVLRLLLSGAPPERILCLTYTKSAAAEMSARIFDDLARWAIAPPDELADALGELFGRPPDAVTLSHSRQLFARAVETPGGLKVQTLHAFCERLLQRFPLEAGVAPGFTILDDNLGGRLMREAVDHTLVAAAASPGSELAIALAEVVRHTQGEAFDALVAAAVARRDWLAAITARRDLDGGYGGILARYLERLGAEAGDSAAAIGRRMAALLDRSFLARLAEILEGGKATDLKAAEAARQGAAVDDEEARIGALRALLLTAEGEPRARLMTKPLAAANPGVLDRLAAAQAELLELDARRHACRAAEATLALAVVADAVRQRYEAAKQQRAALDFDDLVGRAANLLARSEAAEWILFKLDGGLDHLLVDEAQDTSPVQWSVVERLAAEFFAGAGARDLARTVFAVGDEKQSIYSFQGAAPRMFAAMGERLRRLAVEAGAGWRQVPLRLSFRTVPALIEAVDRVFADPERTPGVAFDGAPIRHTAKRLGQAGRIEVWPVEEPDEVPNGDAWAPLADKTPSSPIARLAARIADTIGNWLQREELLASADRPVRAGDILILVRRRRPFAPAMVAALKARGIPVAGADRMALTDQLAVEDLMALARVLLLPEDDLSLAAVLKSPLFALDDDDLIGLAPTRRGSLYTALLAAGRSQPRLAEAAALMRRWRGLADYLPPYELLSRILDADGMRERLIGRLGPEAAEAIDELMAAALAYDETAPPSLQGLVDELTWSRHEIKRDMEQGRNEVRVMTVHGAKGLEAPIVFLPDTCSAASGRRPGGVIDFEPTDDGRPEPLAALWAPAGAAGIAAVRAARERQDHLEEQERNRLLYVALTRARDRLYIAGFGGRRARSPRCWYDTVLAGIRDRLAADVDPIGRTVLRREDAQTAPPDSKPTAMASRLAGAARPAWSRRPAPAERRQAIPVAPSGLAPLEVDDDESVSRPPPTPPPLVEAARAPVPAPTPRELADDGRFLRGTLTHALLEHLPTLSADRWPVAARRFVAIRGERLSARQRASIVAETLKVLADPQFAAVFGPQSRAEVPIVAELADPAGRQPPARIAGQIDRLVRLGTQTLIIDYKTSRPSPSKAADIPVAYLCQLAAYRLALRAVFPGTDVQAAILWTDGPRLMAVPPAALDAHESVLWELGSPSPGAKD